METKTDQDLIASLIGVEAPLLPMLHAFHDRDGHVSEQAVRTISETLRTPIADLWGTVTFYHHLARDENAPRHRVCDGPVCRLRGAGALIDELGDDACTMACSGRCDEPIPVLRGNETLIGTSASHLEHRPSAVPAPSMIDHEECVFAGIREPGRATLDGYGGYAGLERAIREHSPIEVTDLLEESGLAGRGGAGFPTGRKWRAVADAGGEPKTIVCNADEGEPGCFKDRALMDHDPHAIIEGMIAAAYATGASRGFIYLRYEYPETMVILERALEEARDAGWLGPDVGGAGFSFDIHVRRGAGAYICGEETSLLNSLEGKHPFPRNRPPYPVTHGYEDLPTVVNNVETLASVAPILRNGAEWYRGLGIGDHAGTKVISLSGDIVRPGNYEVPIGFSLRTLLDEVAGGAGEGRTIQAVTMAGLSGGFLAGDDLDVTLDEPSIRACGSFLGAGGIIVFDDTRDMVAASESAMEFFAHESCGKCFPCRIGTQRLTERLAGDAGPTDLESWRSEVSDIGDVMMATSACGLGMAAPLIAQSLDRYFPEQVAAHVARTAGEVG